MLGIDDPAIYMAYLFTILSLIGCVIYGIKNWNKDMEPDLQQIEEDIKWERKEEQLNQEF